MIFSPKMDRVAGPLASRSPRPCYYQSEKTTPSLGLDPEALISFPCLRLLAADLLTRVDLLAEHVEAGGRVVHRESRVMRRDVHPVLVQAGVNAAREDLRVQRAVRQPIGARHPVQPGKARHRDGAVERLQARELIRRREGRVLQAPAQRLDAEFTVHRLVSRDDLLARLKALN